MQVQVLLTLKARELHVDVYNWYSSATEERLRNFTDEVYDSS